MSNSKITQRYLTSRLICAKTCSFFSSQQHAYQSFSSNLHFQFTYRFDSIFINVASCVKCLHENALVIRLLYNVSKYFSPNVCISGKKILFTIFAEKVGMVGHFTSSLRHYYCMDTYFLFICGSRITVACL